MKCSKCHFENPADSTFCSRCAAPLHPSEEITISHLKTLRTPTTELSRGSTFAGRYEVIEELGKGGMGNVYRVFDKKIEEEVALKLIKPEIALDRKTIERFKNELKFTRKIAHKNVCRMYDFNEDKEDYYITMEYVAGEDLKSMIRMTRQLNAGQVVFIAKQVCEGLAEAHRLGVVHRDLKSRNIMIDREGNARIMDFGLARSTKEERITGAGVMLGTAEYMSPEQVEGKEADERSDIYSLGVIIYEMITGRLPFEGDSSLSIALKQKTEKPPDPKQFNAQIPEELSRLILRCMEKDREKRYQSAGDLLSELKEIEEGISSGERLIPKAKTAASKEVKERFRKLWMVITVLFVAVVLAGIAILYFSKGKPVPAQKAKMLVVLPFENLGSPKDEYFADGITEELTGRLSALQGLSVISQRSAKQYKDTDKTIRKIGEELGVGYVLEGAVRWNRNQEGKGRVRVTPQLIRVSDDTHLWAESYDRVIEDIFSVQSEIAEQVAQQLNHALLEPERRALNEKPTENLEAWDYYLRGREHEYKGWLHSDAQEFDRAIEMQEKAIELDPYFILAYTRISTYHLRNYFFGVDHTEERLARARAALDKALELNPNHLDVLVALVYYYYWGLQDYDCAVETFESIRKTRPNFDPQILGYIQRRQGKFERALATLEKAFQLNPRDSQLAYEIAGFYISMRRYEQADVWLSRSLSIDPNRLQPQLGKIGIYVLSKGDTQEARALLKTLSQHPLTDYMWLTLGMLERKYQEVLERLSSLSYDSFEEQHFYFEKNLVYASAYHAMKNLSLMKTHAESARLVLEKAIREHPEDPRFHAALGLAYAYLGSKGKAIEEGNRAAELYPVSKDALLGPIYILNLARINTVVGENEEAIKLLKYMLSIPSAEYLWQLVSVPLLQLDPQWDPLRKHPKFMRLLER